MTGLGVERTLCAAYPVPATSPVGAGSPLPPHIQGAERRTVSRARHTGSRWSLRLLVIGGLTGAAWLLTGAAAYAADHTAGPSGPMPGSVRATVDGDATTPVPDLLQAAAQPPEAEHPAHHRHHVVTDILDLPSGVTAHRTEPVDEVTHDRDEVPVDTAPSGADEASPEDAGATRPTGGPTSSDERLDPMPATDAAATGPVVERSSGPAVTPAPAIAQPDRDVTSRLRQSAPVHARIAAHRAHRIRHDRGAAHRHRIVAAAAYPTSKTARKHTPHGDGPAAPLRLHLGDVSGTPTSASGTEGGCAAFLPAAMTSSTMACQRLPIASDVEVRRFDTEAPTVSPD